MRKGIANVSGDLVFSWLKKLSGISNEVAEQSSGALLSNDGNPAKGHIFTVQVTGPAGERSEQLNLTEILSVIFKELGREYSVEKATVRDAATGLEFQPGIVAFQPNDDHSVQTCTTIEIHHPTIFPNRFFEYQHSQGQTGEISIREGFLQWSQLNLPVILDATGELETCTAMEMKFPDGKNRRVVFGPIQYYGPAAKNSSESDGGEHPPFCRCCLFTKSMDAFKSFVEAEGAYAVRLYAAQLDGKPQADCRVNGEDYEAGQRALIQYANTWPRDGTQFRKQYIVIQDR